MRLNWLATTAVALVIGSGAVIAQTQSEQKREEGPRAQQTKDEKAEADGQKNRTGQPEQKGGKEQQGGEANTTAEPKQAQEPQHDTKQPTKQSQEQKQDQQKRGETKQSAEPKQQKQENQARDTKQPDQKNQAQDTKQPEQKNQARDTKQPTDTKQQQGQQQPSTPPSSDQAAQPSTSPSTNQASQPSTSSSTTPSQQSAQPNNTTNQNRQGQTAGQTTDPNRSGTSASVTANDPQRAQVIDRLRNDRAARNPNINIQVSIGERLPPRVRARRLPPDIVRIEPRYRGYEYTVVEDQVYIVEPRTKKVVDIIREPSSSVQTQTTYRGDRSDRVVLSTEQRETLKQSARRLSSAPVAGTPSGTPSGSSPDSSCLTLQPVPEEITRNNPELGQYKMLAIGDQVVLVDPRQQKVVEVIE